MSGDWQTWAALCVVAATVAAFVLRAIRRRRAAKNGCANAADCGCAGAKLGGLRAGGEPR